MSLIYHYAIRRTSCTRYIASPESGVNRDVFRDESFSPGQPLKVLRIITDALGGPGSAIRPLYDSGIFLQEKSYFSYYSVLDSLILTSFQFQFSVV